MVVCVCVGAWLCVCVWVHGCVCVTASEHEYKPATNLSNGVLLLVNGNQRMHMLQNC